MNDAHPPQKPAPAPGKRAAWVLAIAMHLLLAVFLVYGVHWQTKAPEAVEVELVAAAPAPPAAVPPAPTPEPEPTPPKPEPKPEPKPLPKPEPKPLPPPPKPDIAIKEPVKKPPPVPKVPEKVVPKDPVKETPKPPDPFQEQLRRETERLDKHKRDVALDKDLNAAKSAQAASARSKAEATWIARIKGKIRGNIVLPPEVKGSPEALFDVTQLPSGEIVSVHLRKSSGMASLDAAIERAILKSSPLPKPEQGELFQRDLKLTFRPMED